MSAENVDQNNNTVKQGLKDTGLDTQYRKLFEQHLNTVRLEQGQPVYSQSETVKKFYYIQDGLLGLYRFVQPNKRILLYKVIPGESLGVTQLLLGNAYPGHLLPLKDSRCLYGTSEDLEDLKSEKSNLIDDLVLKESQSHSQTYDKVVNFLSGNVDERIAMELLDLVEEIGHDTDGGSRIVIPLTRKEISQMVGSSQETVSRVMSEWEREGTIRTKNKKITVSNPDRLYSLIEFES